MLAQWGRQSWTPASLVAGSVGLWFDSQDLSSLYQDTTGATQVTAVEQSVGMILDKSNGLARGATVIANGDFSGGTASWTQNGTGTFTVSNGQATITNNAAAEAQIQQVGVLVLNAWYEVTIDVISGTSGCALVLGSTRKAVPSGLGRRYILQCVGGTTFAVGTNVGTNGATSVVDNITVCPLPGNHATFSPAPTLSALYNQLISSENLGGTGWTARTNNSVSVTGNVSTLTNSGDVSTTEGVWQQGAGVGNTSYKVVVKAYQGSLSQMMIVLKDNASDTVRASQLVTLTSTEQVFSITGTTAGATTGFRVEVGTNGVSGTINITGVDVRPSDDGVKSIPVYQKVVTTSNYDTAGFPLYLKAGGAAAGVTGTVDFSGTDKVTVIASITRNLDAGTNSCMLIETSTNSGLNAGTFGMVTPNSGVADYQFRSGGSTPAGAVLNVPVGTYTPPHTAILTAITDISGTSAVLRVNGVQKVTSSASQGTGNFTAQAVNLFQRSGGTLIFNGRLYGLVIPGRKCSAGDLAQAESYFAQRCGIALST